MSEIASKHATAPYGGLQQKRVQKRIEVPLRAMGDCNRVLISTHDSNKKSKSCPATRSAPKVVQVPHDIPRAILPAIHPSAGAVLLPKREGVVGREHRGVVHDEQPLEEVPLAGGRKLHLHPDA